MFLLPKNIHSVEPLLSLTLCDGCGTYISHSLAESVKYHKQLIENYKMDWDLIKKQVNPYEYIHSHILNKPFSVSAYKPLSRSYYKLVELYYKFKLADYFKDSITTFHLAEGPGGFMEAILNLRNNKKDKYHGMTLIDGKNSPGWRQHNILSRNSNIILDNGADDTGNILHPCNYEHCYKHYKGTMDLVTADGGFDFSKDYNAQEHNSCKLIFAEVMYAITMQKEGGTFILKLFDCFLQVTNELLYILSMMYDEVHITKPSTSRCANSERYVVCVNFKTLDNYSYYPTIYNMLLDIQNGAFIQSIINVPIPIYVCNALQEINTLLAQTQIDYINKTINYIKHNNIPASLLSTNINKCIRWCNTYNININSNVHDIKNIRI
mgnify:CR=1 FL=1|jgi:23S rRNA U2552 (ribose-2'-O)-methylase RlmE/FtsJ